MKKIALITIHLGANFGSILQTIATAKVFKGHQFDTEIINYIPERCTWKRFFLQSIKTVRNFIKMFFAFPVTVANNHIYNSYLAKFANVSKAIYKSDNFVEVCPKADIYVTGSDQVWNSSYNEGFDGHYFFENFPADAVKVAYSSSVGNVKIGKEEYDKMKTALHSYKAISVREVSAKELIESMGYEVVHLLDPTFMLNADEWKPYMSERMIREPYLLVYLPYNTHDRVLIYKSVRKIADRKKLKVIAFSWNIFPDKLADKTIFFANPGDFLSLMYYAEYVITNSFHGTAFSINLNKQFSVYAPTGYATRIISILDLCALNGRLLESDEIISDAKMDCQIDYGMVNSVLEKEREKANEFLTKALNH